ncbi:hypothetical protein PMIN03_011385, partial [Paraphaeosphaeria minitans]
MNNLPPPPPVVRIASEPPPRPRSPPRAYKGQKVSGGPGSVLQLPSPPPPPGLAHGAPEPLHPPVPPPTLPSLPTYQKQSGAGGSRKHFHLPPLPAVIGFVLPPPPGLAHVAPEPPPRPIFPRPLPSLPAYEGQRVPGSSSVLLDLNCSFQLQKWNTRNRLGPLWDHLPSYEHESLEKWIERQAVWGKLYQDEPLIQHNEQPVKPTVCYEWFVSIPNLLNLAQSASIHAVNRFPHNLLNPAEDTSNDTAIQSPQAESSSAAAARPQGAVGSKNHPDFAATSPITSIEVSNTPPPWGSSPHPHSEPDLHLDRHDISPNLPPSRRLSLPAVPSFEDFSTLPVSIAQKLQYSAQLSLSTACASTSGPQYELVEEDYVPSQAAPVSEKTSGPFMSRHTANFEAAKMFTHRFWEQVMVRGQAFEVHIGEAGILTMSIRYRDGRGGKRETSVFVRKGSPGQLGGAGAV